MSAERFGGMELSGLAAARVLGRLTLTRLWRGKLVWVTALLALAPVAVPLLTGLGSFSMSRWRDSFAVLSVLLAILPALHAAPAMAEEIEDKTFTYLWSRPFPRWSLLAGKLSALLSVVAGLLLVSLTAMFALIAGPDAGEHLDVFVWGLVAVVFGVLASGATAVGLGTIVPRHGTASALIYLLTIDTSIGAMPFSLHALSVNYHVRQLAAAARDTSIAAADSIGWLLGLTALWLGIAVWRVTAAEPATDR